MTDDKTPMILLSFDTEEFDLPREHGAEIALSESVAVSTKGIMRLLDILDEASVRATFFCTATFAEQSPEALRRIVGGGHEVASHGLHHWQPQPGDAASSKPLLEQLCGLPVAGYRHPRMLAVDNDEIARAGYRYNSSLHPTLIPGRYNHLDMPRTPFVSGGVLQIPCSVTPWLRLPVFWLACHHYPMWLYRRLCLRTLRHDGQFVVYFHPWEFVDLAANAAWRVPWTIRRRSGNPMARRLRQLIEAFKADGAQFITYSEFADRRLTTTTP